MCVIPTPQADSASARREWVEAIHGALAALRGSCVYGPQMYRPKLRDMGMALELGLTRTITSSQTPARPHGRGWEDEGGEGASGSEDTDDEDNLQLAVRVTLNTARGEEEAEHAGAEAEAKAEAAAAGGSGGSADSTVWLSLQGGPGQELRSAWWSVRDETLAELLFALSRGASAAAGAAGAAAKEGARGGATEWVMGHPTGHSAGHAAGEKRFACQHPGCAKRFATASGLTYHARSHAGGRAEAPRAEALEAEAPPGPFDAAVQALLGGFRASGAAVRPSLTARAAV